MGENSKIEWTDHTFNGWVGCTKVSPACKFCYAEKYATRWSIAQWGDKGTRHLTADGNWNKLDKWNRAAAKEGVRRKVFCFSLADLFEDHPMIKQEWRDRFWLKAKECEWLDLLCLTKRPENFVRFLPSDWCQGYDNVWLGVSVEDQKRYDERVNHLKYIPASRKFFSMEPLLSFVKMSWLPDWIIIGGESGFLKDARPLNLACVADVIQQCNEADVHVFFKQLGTQVAKKLKLKDDKGGDFTEYPTHLSFIKYREVPPSPLSLNITDIPQNKNPVDPSLFDDFKTL